jgi:pimeloyl-ACP methyl ester carboxylesterase
MSVSHRELTPQLRAQYIEAQRRKIEERYHRFQRNSEVGLCSCGTPLHLGRHLLYPLLASPDTCLLPVLGSSALHINGFETRRFSTMLGLVKCVRLTTGSPRRTGSGPPLIMCSGLASKLTDHFSLLIQLAKRKFFRWVGIVDIPGHSLTPAVSASVPPVSLATATGSLLQAIQGTLEEADGGGQADNQSRGVFLLGLSMGARLVMELATRPALSLPFRIAGVVLVVPLGAPLSPQDQEKLMTVYDVQTYRQAKLITQQAGGFSTGRARVEVVANCATFRRMRKYGTVALIHSDIMTNPISPDTLRTVSQRYPFLALFGGKDGIIPPESIDYFAAHTVVSITPATAATAAGGADAGASVARLTEVKLVPKLTHNSFVFPADKLALEDTVSFCRRAADLNLLPVPASSGGV